MSKKRWYKSKTVWTGLSSIVGTVASVATGIMTIPAAAPVIVMSLMGIFIRDAIDKQ